MSQHSKAGVVRNPKVPNTNKSRSGVNRRNKSSVPTFIDSKCYRGQAIDRKVLFSKFIPLSTSSTGTIAEVFDFDPYPLLDTTWSSWANIYEEYRISRVVVELRPIQGSDTKGFTAFYFDPDGNTTPSLAQAQTRMVKTIRNNNMNASPHTMSFEFREIEDLSYQPTDQNQKFCNTTFNVYTDASAFDSPNNTQLYTVRFHFHVIFKNLRVLRE